MLIARWHPSLSFYQGYLVNVYDPTLKVWGPTLELYDTIREKDVDMNAGYIAPFLVKGSKSVQTIVRNNVSRGNLLKSFILFQMKNS